MDNGWNLGANVNLKMIFDRESSFTLGLTLFVSIVLALLVALFVYGKYFR
jgi:hypothetical protein